MICSLQACTIRERILESHEPADWTLLHLHPLSLPMVKPSRAVRLVVYVSLLTYLLVPALFCFISIAPVKNWDDIQPVRLTGSYSCWFVKKYCWLVCVREKYCFGWKFTIVYDKYMIPLLPIQFSQTIKARDHSTTVTPQPVQNIDPHSVGYLLITWPRPPPPPLLIHFCLIQSIRRATKVKLILIYAHQCFLLKKTLHAYSVPHGHEYKQHQIILIMETSLEVVQMN